jgi:hypothetical protein
VLQYILRLKRGFIDKVFGGIEWLDVDMWRISGGALTHNQSAAAAGGFGVEAVAEVVDDLVVELLATVGPAAGADHLFYAAAEAIEADDFRRGFEMIAQLGAEHLEENEFADAVATDDQRAEIAVYDAPGGFRAKGGHVQAETAQDFRERLGEFADGHDSAVKFRAKIMEHGVRGVLDDYLIDLVHRVAEEFQRHLLGGTGDVFTGRRFENQAIGA